MTGAGPALARAPGKDPVDAARDLVRRWREDLAGPAAPGEVSAALYRWSRSLWFVWPPLSWWPWGLEGGIRHPLSGWLVCVEACGAPPGPPLLAPADAPGEGLAGLVWHRGTRRGEQVERLLPDPGSPEYGTRCGLSPAHLARKARGGWLPRWEYGFVVEVAGRPWGVLVTECSTADLRADAAVRRAAKTLAQGLERALQEAS